MYLILLIVSLAILLVIDYVVLFKNELSAPAFLFCAGLFLCSINLSLFVKEWNVYIHQGTYWLVYGGVLSFTISCWLVHAKHHFKPILASSIPKRQVMSPIIKISRLKFLFLLSLFLYVVKSYFLMSYYGGNLAAALYLHTEAMKFGDDAMKYPFGLSFLVSLPDFYGTFFAYLSAVYCFKRNYKKQRFWIWTNFIICLLGSLLSSGRTNMLWLIVVFGISYFIAMKRNNNSINVRKIVIVLLSMYVFAISFQQIGYLIGRKETEDFSMAIFVQYCGAELQNLDDFIYSDHINVKTTHFGEVTFENFWSYFNVQSRRDEVLTFNSRRGFGLGNVKTTFHSYYIDFGFWGTIVMCFIVGLFMQGFYARVKNGSNWQTGEMSVPLYVFLTMIPACFMSFFSEYFVNKGISLLNYRVWFSYILVCYIIYGNKFLFNKRSKWIK